MKVLRRRLEEGRVEGQEMGGGRHGEMAGAASRQWWGWGGGRARTSASAR